MHTTDIDSAREASDDQYVGMNEYPAFPERSHTLTVDWVAEGLRDMRTLRDAFSADNSSMEVQRDWDYFLLEVGEMVIDCRAPLPSEEEARFAEIGRKFYELAMAHVNKSLDEEE